MTERIAPPDGAFYIYADIGHLTHDSLAFCERLLRDTGVATAPGLDFDPVNGHRPSVDVLFDSVAELAGRNAVGVILTGMGNDGTNGCSLIHNAGGRVIAEAESTCVVYGMPRSVVESPPPT